MGYSEKSTGHFHVAMLQYGDPTFNSLYGTTKNFKEDRTKELINKVKSAIDNGVTGL